MRQAISYSLRITLLFLIGLLSGTAMLHAQDVPLTQKVSADTTHFHLIFPFRDYTGIPYLDTLKPNPLYLKTPSNIKKEIIYNPVTNTYQFVSKVGNFEYRTPTVMDFKDFQKYETNKSVENYWQQRALTRGTAVGTRLIPKIYVKGKAFEQIFGSNSIDIRPQGTAEISMGVLSNYRDDPTLDVNQLRTTNFDFNEKIQMNVDAKIGDKLSFKANYNTESSFNFENTLKLRYVGKKDDIIKSIEAGNVSMPLQSSLITGAQSLFGVKTKLQFGKTTVTAVFSQQQSQTQNITIQNGAEQNTFKMTPLDYESNRHFFLSQYFRDHYQQALKTLPIVTSDINITKIEVWVTNIGPATSQNRNIVAFTDLGEGKASEIFNPNVTPLPGATFPANKSNDLLSRMDTTQIRNINTVTSYLSGDPLHIGKTGYFTSGMDYAKLENARLLKPSEYTVNTKLGFISLNTALNDDQVLAVAFQYTVIGQNKVYQVGEFSDQGINTPKDLIVKLLKSNTLDTHMPMWNLMMKNVYSIGAYQVQQKDFVFNILYSGNAQGVPTGYFTEGPTGVKGVPLIHLFGLDNLDSQQNPIQGGDGFFDFIDGAETKGGTFQASDGHIYFTVLQPFGSYIHTNVFPNNPNLADKYAYDSLYTMTKTQAEQYADKNKFILEGSYKSQSGSTINLNAMNIPPGSVKVTAGGVPLQENVDYTVDYTLGQITILNQGLLNSGTPIHVSLENNSLFNVQQKTMMGIHVEHEFTPDFHLGATFLNLHERPLTQKVNYGQDPLSNTVWGLNLAYTKNSRWISKLLSKLPGTTPNTPSKINYNAELAEFLPGHSRTVGKSGTSYVDDFEGAKSTIDLTNVNSWFLASTPQGQTNLFPEAAPNTGLAYGMNRALFSWYIIDPSVFYDVRGNNRPKNITKDEISKNSTRQVLESEVFPNKDIPNGTPTNIPVFNLSFFPSERGEYNYDVYPGPYSAGILANGDLADPQSRWGGMMRALQTTDFDASNIQYIEFWMMDPFTSDPNNQGQLYIDLGDVSEDILRDGRKSYENGLPTSDVVTNVDTTLWGRVPQQQALVESFSNIAGSRQFQDVGYDGLGDKDEDKFFQKTYLDVIKQRYGTSDSAYIKAYHDPSADDYHYYRGTDFDNNPLYSSITERYKRYDEPEGNSTPNFPEPEPYSTVATNIPNKEDINNDNTLSESERYYQYKINLNPSEMKVGENYITDIHQAANIHLPNGKTTSVKWYQFMIPVRIPNKIVGNIQGFQSIRFMRVFMRGFAKPIVCRFATFELVRGDWRTYDQSLLSPGEYLTGDAADKTHFVVSTVNLEENANRSPVPYVIPPGISREVNYGTTNYVRLNEQSLQFTVENLQDGDSRAAYKNVSFDFRQYKDLKMFIHAEKLEANENIKDGDLTVFIRIGSDFTQNYYEYEIPVQFTPWYTSSADPNAIWPAANQMDVNLSRLVQVKEDRNVAMRGGSSGVSLTMPYTESDGTSKITVMGSPNLGDVTGIMIGVRNPRQLGNASGDDGQPKGAIIWLDELRLTGFNKSPGWAATGQLVANLSDLGRFAASGSFRSAGFGSLDQHLNEISQDNVSNYAVSTDLDLGKFFSKKTGMVIPLHVDYGKAVIVPKYNPLNPDVLLKNDLATYATKAEKDSIRNLAIDYTRNTSFSLMNVHKERTNFSGKQKKPKLYDPENFNASFSYSQILHHNTDIAMNNIKTYQGGFGYNYNTRPRNIEPFKKAKKMNSPWLRWLKDFNFNLVPSVISFRTDMNRLFNSMLYRDKSSGDIIIYPTYMRQWTWDRNYSLQYNLTQSLNINYTAGANAYIREPQIYPDKNTEAWTEYKREIWNQIESMGTLQNFNHSLQASYTVPLSKVPLTDWINLMGNYQVQYNWNASPLSVQSSFGNTIQNARNIQVNGGFDFNQLYNKIPFLKKINDRGGSQRPFERRFGPGVQSQTKESGKKKKEGARVGKFESALFRILMTLQNANFVYQKSDGIQMSGFTPIPSFMGVDLAQNAPGFGFVFGSQRDIRSLAAQNGWITKDTTLNEPYITKLTEQLSYKVNGNILNAINIDLDGNRIYAKNYTSYFRYSPSDNIFENYAPQEAGNFSISYPFIRTSFDRSNASNISAAFERFKSDRLIIAERLAQSDPNWSGKYAYDSLARQQFPVGYSSTQQQVMYYAFLAAYSGKSPNGVDIGHTFPVFPYPNWRVSFSGLTHIPAIRKIFRSFNMNFGYSSILSINAWSSNVSYDPQNPGALYPGTDNFVNQIDLGSVSFFEQYNPLIGIDFTMMNSLGGRIAYKKTRNIVLSFANDQITEINGNEIDVGLSYHVKGLKLAIKNFTGRPSRKYNTDLNLKLDVGVQDNKTILRQIDQEDNQISAGARQYTVNFAADYLLSQNLQLRAYFNWNENNPYVSSQYLNSTTSGGLTLRFLIGQ
ncbi:MAG: cell surface protein SprA [Bacteroidales bacterium]|nr:cell surface protein SprA [Bacteroidales bacterium]